MVLEMDGRYDHIIVDALESVAKALHGKHNRADDKLCCLKKFQRDNPLKFKGRYDPEGALAWLKEIEKIFRVMACIEEHKALFGTHMLSEESEDWWDNTHQRLEVNGTEVAWVVFRERFLEKYFPEDVRSKKEIEFLELKQINSTVAEYAAKFDELVIGYQEIRRFSVLVKKCIIYDKDIIAQSGHYKSIIEKKWKGPFRGKAYVTTVDKGKQKTTFENKPSGGGAFTLVQYYKGYCSMCSVTSDLVSRP
ncbi:uncharacterized protein LOC127138128 [Lathyrus oleraceus]|uniref:uncharacterized protein LOC127138128 n=1 Tax=Pisum sativum TaxID=3888 RepID=UPI0021D34147|nr:uncharacterized protein LOC127138128 [Pisum sativum]